MRQDGMQSDRRCRSDAPAQRGRRAALLQRRLHAHALYSRLEARWRGALLWLAWGAVDRGLRSRAAAPVSMSISWLRLPLFPLLSLFALDFSLRDPRVAGSCCDRKHFWEGLEYDNYPVVFNLSLNCPTHYDASGKSRNLISCT